MSSPASAAPLRYVRCLKQSRCRVVAAAPFLAMLAACGGGSGSGPTPAPPVPVPPQSYKIGGTVGGLVGTLVLTNNTTDSLSLTQSGSFTFGTSLPSGSVYKVAVSQQPTEQTCTVSHGTGTVSATVSDVAIVCTSNQRGGPPLTGLASSGVASVTLTSDAGDPVGSGVAHQYSSADTSIRVTTNGNWFAITIDGTDDWSGWVQLPPAFAQFQVGTFAGLNQYPPPGPPGTLGSFDWSGNDRECQTGAMASVTVNSVTYVAGAMTAIDFNFDQYCTNVAPGLHGHVIWQAAGTTVTIQPVSPPPGLWQAPADATPASGNYLYVESDTTDYVGQGSIYSETQADSLLSLTISNGVVQITAQGADTFSGQLNPMIGLTQLQPGYYGKLRRYPFDNPARGGLSWAADQRGCSALAGWFVVDSVTYANGALTALDLRFEQDCQVSTAALHGQLHWRANDPTQPPGPTSPPAGLWTPPAGATPASGDYVYLSADAGDYIGAGLEGPATQYLYTSPASSITVDTTGPALGPNLTVTAAGVGGWVGQFAGTYVMAAFTPGYYGPLTTTYDPAVGMLNWDGMGRGCDYITGWFVIDGVSYSGTTLTGIELRFEQHCQGAKAALHGKIHWGSP